MLITTATLNRKIVAFSLGAMLGALATQIVMMATGSREPIEDYHHGNQASAYSLAPDPVYQLSTPTPTEAAPEAIEEIGRKVRLLCLIMTHPGNYKNQSYCANNTWANSGPTLRSFVDEQLRLQSTSVDDNEELNRLFDSIPDLNDDLASIDLDASIRALEQETDVKSSKKHEAQYSSTFLLSSVLLLTFCFLCIDLNLTDAYNNLWQKAWMSFDWAERWLNLDQFDFVLKADDDTFVVVENLRLLLARWIPDSPSIWAGGFSTIATRSRATCPAGWLRLVQSCCPTVSGQSRAISFNTQRVRPAGAHCGGLEDGTCLSSLGVKFVDSRDVGGLDRFHPINVEYMIGWGPAEMPPWMWKINYYKFRACLEKCVSSVAATFHYTDNLYLMEFLLYGRQAMPAMRPNQQPQAASTASSAPGSGPDGSQEFQRQTSQQSDSDCTAAADELAFLDAVLESLAGSSAYEKLAQIQQPQPQQPPSSPEKTDLQLCGSVRQRSRILSQRMSTIAQSKSSISKKLCAAVSSPDLAVEEVVEEEDEADGCSEDPEVNLQRARVFYAMAMRAL
uniref:Hexosyltransferase n=1 Tax=Macrostomum lignano TaxID=282301 RepID=A0A1I8FRQ9_9PLAT